ncbi:MAG: hypothetical protein Q9227_002931 [Pyrenula ochraceoflavens]
MEVFQDKQVNTLEEVQSIPSKTVALVNGAVPRTIEHDEHGLMALYGNRFYAAARTTDWWRALEETFPDSFSSSHYKFEPARDKVHGPYDDTSFVPSHSDWGSSRDNCAPICYQLKPTNEDYLRRSNKKNKLLIINFNEKPRMIVDVWKNEPLNYFKLNEMPVRISKFIEGFRVAQILRQDSRITKYDLVQRMSPPCTAGPNDTWIPQPMDVDKLIHRMTQRYQRFQEQNRLLTWPPKESSLSPVDQMMLYELERVDPEGLAANTTIAIDSISNDEVDKARKDYRDRFPDNDSKADSRRYCRDLLSTVNLNAQAGINGRGHKSTKKTPFTL